MHGNRKKIITIIVIVNVFTLLGKYLAANSNKFSTNVMNLLVYKNVVAFHKERIYNYSGANSCIYQGDKNKKCNGSGHSEVTKTFII